MNIVLTTKQLETIKNVLESLSKEKNVSELDIMYNPNITDNIFIRYKNFYTTEEGAVAVEINYICVNLLGESRNCLDTYGDTLYAVIKDCVSINMSSPLIKIV